LWMRSWAFGIWRWIGMAMAGKTRLLRFDDGEDGLTFQDGDRHLQLARRLTVPMSGYHYYPRRGTGNIRNRWKGKTRWKTP